MLYFCSYFRKNNTIEDEIHRAKSPATRRIEMVLHVKKQEGIYIPAIIFRLGKLADMSLVRMG